MLIQPEEDDKDSYDRFRGRLMIPIRDARGRVIAFGGRILGAGEPKYLNSPDTPLFDKGRTLYNIDRAGPASRAGQAPDRGRRLYGRHRPRPRRHRRGRRAQRHRGHRGAARAACGGSTGSRSAASTATRPGRRRRSAPRSRALPHLGPERTLRFVALPAGQDPDDVVRSGGREAIEALLAAPEPLVERLWRHEVEAAPLDTPEARAGLKAAPASSMPRRSATPTSASSTATNGCAVRRAGPPAGRPGPLALPAPEWKKGKDGRFVPPAPAGQRRRPRDRHGRHRPPTARALVLGHALYPDAIGDHVEALAALPIADRAAAKLRDRMVDLAMSGQMLDRQGIATILAAEETAAAWRDVSKGGDIGFPSRAAKSDPERARRDLGLAIEALVAKVEIEAALAKRPSARFRAGDEAAFDEQQRLHAAREEIQ